MSRSPILPDAIEAELARLPWRIVGIALFAGSACGWLSLLSWSINDPSFNRATEGAPSNLLGRFGATLADLLFQGFGFAAIALFLPMLFWGWNIFNGVAPAHPRRRFAFWPLSVAVLSSALGALPIPAAWPLPNGLGGVAGDILSSPFIRMGGLLEPNLAHVLGGAGATALGGWLLLRACDVHFRDLIPEVTLQLPDFSRDIAERAAQKAARAAAEVSEYDPEPPESVVSAVIRQARERFDQLRERAMVLIQRLRPVGTPPSGESGEDWMTGDPGLAPPASPAPEPAREAGRESAAPAAAAPAAFQAETGGETAGAEPAAVPAAPHREPHFGSTIHRTPGLASLTAWHEPEAETFRYGATAQASQVHAAPAQALQASAAAGGARAAGGAAGAQFRIIHGGAAVASARPAAGDAPRQGETLRPVETFRPAGTPRTAPPASDAQNAFTLPPLTLLKAPDYEPHRRPDLSDEALGQRADLLLGVLSDFGVKGRIVDVHPGPVITLYVLEPARGTKSSRVIGLADDIARSMSAVSARVAVIPGRDAIGVELPNDSREIVYLRELLDGEAYRASPAKLALALGKTIGGDPVVTDLARMPHLLIAGTTGSGKSVGINTMILSLLYRLTPEQCRFIMIDPKMLELSVYDGIPHLLTPVVTDPRKAIVALKWTVNEMNVRYERMCKVGVRNIQGYNQKVLAARKIGAPLIRTVQTGFDEASGAAIYEHEDMSFDTMPHIVVVIDEMADLMLVAGKDIEYAVQRLSQMARAAGIHLIMATQRPSVDVITGTIKANFPSRISFQVTSKIDSRTILGEQGAEQLLGQGDMLFMAAGGRIMRAHGPFVADDEVEKVVNFLKAQGEPHYLADVLAASEDDEEEAGETGGERESSGDDLYDQAVDVVLTDRKPTTSYLQRRLGVGYNRAASLIERMEKEGLVSPPNRTGKREILVGGEGVTG